MKKNRKLCSQEKKVTKREQKAGSSLDHFMALCNLYREFTGVKTLQQVKKYWIENRAFIKYLDLKRNRNDDYQESVVIGIDSIIAAFSNGGIIISYHYGDYRKSILNVMYKLREYKPDVHLSMVVDRDSFLNEPKHLSKEIGYDFLIAESTDIIYQIIECIRKGGFVFLFIDGNTGSGKDKYPLELMHINSRVTLRSGFFRLIVMKKIAVYSCISIIDNISESTRINKIDISKNEPKELADECYSILTNQLKTKPQYWRFWFRHHKNVIYWPKGN